MRSHPIFRKFDPEEDSCFIAAHLANERYRRPERKDERTGPSRYEASDDDLPQIFFEPADV